MIRRIPIILTVLLICAAGASGAGPASGGTPTPPVDPAARLRAQIPLMDAIRDRWMEALDTVQHQDKSNAVASLKLLVPLIGEFREAMRRTEFEPGASNALENAKSMISALEKGDQLAVQGMVDSMTLLGRSMEEQIKAALEASPVPETGPVAGTNAPPQRIGVYDSRVVAYANFWSDAHQQKLNAMVKDAREAKAAGQTERFNELEAAIKTEQDRNHLQVFSTAPVDDVLAGMKDSVAKIQVEAGVSRLVSKWDEQALKEFKDARQVDVTDLLLGEFKLTDQQNKVAADLRTKKPLPLDEAKKLLSEGKL